MAEKENKMIKNKNREHTREKIRKREGVQSNIFSVIEKNDLENYPELDRIRKKIKRKKEAGNNTKEKVEVKKEVESKKTILQEEKYDNKKYPHLARLEKKFGKKKKEEGKEEVITRKEVEPEVEKVSREDPQKELTELIKERDKLSQELEILQTVLQEKNGTFTNINHIKMIDTKNKIEKKTVEELREKFQNMSDDKLKTLIQEGDSQLQELAKKMEELKQKLKKEGFEFEEITESTKKEVKKTLEEEGEEKSIVDMNLTEKIVLVVKKYATEIQEALKKRVEEKKKKKIESKKKLEEKKQAEKIKKTKSLAQEQYEISEKLYQKMRMDSSANAELIGKVHNSINETKDLFDEENIEIEEWSMMTDKLKKINDEIREKDPYLLPTEEKLEIAKNESKQIMGEIKKLLKEEKFLSVARKSELERKLVIVGDELKNISENYKKIDQSTKNRMDLIDEVKVEIEQEKEKQEKERIEKVQREKEEKIAKEAGESLLSKIGSLLDEAQFISDIDQPKLELLKIELNEELKYISTNYKKIEENKEERNNLVSEIEKRFLKEKKRVEEEKKQKEQKVEKVDEIEKIKEMMLDINKKFIVQSELQELLKDELKSREEKKK